MPLNISANCTVSRISYFKPSKGIFNSEIHAILRGRSHPYTLVFEFLFYQTDLRKESVCDAQRFS
jgi:hypothetical protein